MAKPMLVTLPFVLLLLDYWPLNRMPLPARYWFPRAAWEPAGPDAPPPRSRAERGNEESTGLFPQQSWLHLIVEKLPLLALSAGSCAATISAQQRAIASNERIEFPLRLANAAASLLGYLVQWLYPANLAAMYPFPLSGVARVSASWRPYRC